MKYKKFILSTLLSGVLGAVALMNSSSAAYYLEIDNGQPGYSTGNSNTTLEPFKAVSASGSKNQDARLANTDPFSSDFYYWMSPYVNGGSYTVQVYLNDYRFNNRSTHYQISSTSTIALEYIIDQYSAPAGWTKLSTTFQSGYIQVKVYNFGTSATSTGADTVLYQQ